MQIRLDQLGDEPLVWEETLEVTPQELDHPDLLAVGPVRVRGRVSRAHPGYLLQASLSYPETLACTRCLAPTEVATESRVELLVLVGGEEPSADERELAGEDLGVLLLEEPELETRPILVEQLQLDVPMRPLCREDCAGLCPTCGADRNAGPCTCQPSTDPRWSALARWKTSPPPSAD